MPDRLGFLLIPPPYREVCDAGSLGTYELWCFTEHLRTRTGGNSLALWLGSFSLLLKHAGCLAGFWEQVQGHPSAGFFVGVCRLPSCHAQADLEQDDFLVLSSPLSPFWAGVLRLSLPSGSGPSVTAPVRVAEEDNPQRVVPHSPSRVDLQNCLYLAFLGG